jgi:O-antigen ligase
MAAVMPWSLAAMQIGFALIIAYNIFVAIKDRTFPLKYHPIFIIIFMFIAFCFLSSLFSKDVSRSFIAIVNTQWILLLIPVLVFTPLNEQQRNMVMRTLILSSAIAAIYSLFQFITGMDLFRGRQLANYGNYYRASGGYNFYLTFAGNQLMIFFPAFFLFLKEEKWNRTKTTYLLCSILILLGILATFARSAWIALILSLFIGLYFTRKRLLLKSLFPVTVFIIIVSIIFPELPNRFLSSFNLASNETRLTIWKTSLNMISNKPLFGIGSGFFSEVFDDYKAPGFYDTTTHAHNDYLNLAVNNGIFASILWIGIWIFWFFYAIRFLRSRIITKFDKFLLTSILMSILGILVAAFFQCYYTDLENNIFWLFLFAISLQIIFASDNENGNR